MVSAFASVIAASIAYSTFSAATTEFNGLIKNWEKAPITAFAFPVFDRTTNGNTCAADFSLVHLPVWPGTYSSACACGQGAATESGGAQVSSATSTCNGNQTAAGCIDQPYLGSVPLDYWRGGSVCIQRGGEAQLVSDKRTRVVPTKDDPCEKQGKKGEYKTCGGTSYTSDRATCVKADAACPVTEFAFTASGASHPPGFDTTQGDKAVAALDGSGSFDTQVESPFVLPLNELEFVFFDEISGKRGICFQQSGSGQEEYDSAGASFGYTNNYPSQCSGRFDKRWEVLDKLNEGSVLKQTFDKTAACTESSGGQQSDYLSTGTPCGPAVSVFSNRDCAVQGATTNAAFSNPGSQGCAGTDGVCKAIAYQSKCGQLQRWATQQTTWKDSTGTKTIALMGRHEIYWKPDCEVSMIQLKGVQKPVNNAKGGLLGNMVVNILANLFIGLVFPFLLIYNLCYGDVPCIPGEGKVEAALLQKHKKYGNVLFHFLKLMPALAALAHLAEAGGLLGEAAESGCYDKGDVRTQETFDDMHAQLTTSHDALVSQVTMDIGNIMVALIMAMMAHLSHHEGKEAASEAELHAEHDAEFEAKEGKAREKEEEL